MSCTALDILLLQPPDKPSGRHEEDGVWGWSVPLFAVWGAAWITRGQLGGVWRLQKGSEINYFCEFHFSLSAKPLLFLGFLFFSTCVLSVVRSVVVSHGLFGSARSAENNERWDAHAKRNVKLQPG